MKINFFIKLPKKGACCKSSKYTTPDALWWISLPIILAAMVSLIYITSILISKKDEIRACKILFYFYICFCIFASKTFLTIVLVFRTSLKIGQTPGFDDIMMKRPERPSINSNRQLSIASEIKQETKYENNLNLFIN